MVSSASQHDLVLPLRRLGALSADSADQQLCIDRACKALHIGPSRALRRIEQSAMAETSRIPNRERELSSGGLQRDWAGTTQPTKAAHRKKATSREQQSSPKNLSDLAHERLLDMLLSGELTAGATLQERRLAERLKISRTPIREALARLESEGLVHKAGRLMTVSQISVQTYIEILNVRKLMEVEAAGLAAERRIDKGVAENIRAAIWGLMETDAPTPAEHWAVDDIVHGVISEAADNALLAKMIRELRRRTHLFNTRRIPGRLRPGSLEHLALIDAVAAGDSAKARRLMAEHIDNVKAAIVDQLVSGRTAT
jgi:DNA-binding GntR family transcriptional regulator